MAGKTYVVTKGYSTHTNIPTPQNGFDHGPRNPGNIQQWPSAGLTDFVGSPSKAELLKEYIHAPSMSKTPKYASPAQEYEPNNGLSYENSSPPKYHGGPNQSSWPLKTSDFSTQNKYHLSSPVHGYPSKEAPLIHSEPGLTDFVGSPSKAELLREYVHATSMSKTPKYASPAQEYEPNYGLNYENSSPPKYHGGPNQSSWPLKTSGFSTQNKYHLSSPVHGYPSKEAPLIHSEPGLEGAKYSQTENISVSTKSWQISGPPATLHPLTSATNNINEALGFLEESVYYSPHADPRRRGVLDNLSTHAQPIEPLRRYARPAFVAKPKDAHYNFSNTGSTINSHEATRRYHGTLMP